MKKIKDTLNLPKTGFSMKANLAQKEPEMIKYWEDLTHLRVKLFMETGWGDQ